MREEGWIQQHLPPTNAVLTPWLAAFHNLSLIVASCFLRLLEQIHACKPSLPQTPIRPTEEGRAHGQAE